jgi:hypothetical protein
MASKICVGSMHLLHSSSWVSLQLPPETFDFTLNIDEDWVPDRSNVSGTEYGAGFRPVADPYKKGPEFSSLVHCTTMPWDAYMLSISGEVGKLRNPMQTSDILIRWHCYTETIEKRAFAGLCTLMLWRTMVSQILFKNTMPVTKIPPIHVTTEHVTFPTSSGTRQFYIFSVDSSNNRLRERITGVASAQATTMGKMQPFGTGWWFIHLISITLVLGPASIDPEITSSNELQSFLPGWLTWANRT